MTDEVKLVKVDNWGIFFLQRLKHFFNRTDYCDLTLQFQDNAQLKVHRLVLSACTEYFELLERTCEMYEDCLVMPDDLQADVVVPIVNFMYTGQLEFRMDLLERLYQTSQIMNMPVLTKLLDAHRSQAIITPVNQPPTTLNYHHSKRSYSKPKESSFKAKQMASTPSSSKRSYTRAFGNDLPQKEVKKSTPIIHKPQTVQNNGVPITTVPYHSPPHNSSMFSKKTSPTDPRPTRYELPEELDTDNIFDSSFTNISYASQPLMVHPDTTKQYQRKKGTLGGSRKLGSETSTLDIVQCKRVPKQENIFDDDHDHIEPATDELEMFHVTSENSPIASNQLFDQIIDEPSGPKVTIETKDSKQASNIDHAKIISEVLKKYPHLVKSSKNIKLKILNTPVTSNKPKTKRQRNSPTPYHNEKEVSVKTETPDTTFESEVLDSKEAARLIAMGAENVKGPWICLICGTPGRALHFTTYYKFRRHLVEVHREKPVANMCEHCGLKSLKRNYLLHHLLTKHGVEPPPQYNFPKCNFCNYVALTESLLTRHKSTHSEIRNFRCNVCQAGYNTSNQLLAHIQATGHKYCADRKVNLQCVYCQKVFLREGNLYAHLKTYHKHFAKTDGIIEDSDDEGKYEKYIKYEPTPTPSFDMEFENNEEEIETQYQIRPDGNIEIITEKRQIMPNPTKQITKQQQKILNTGLEKPVDKPIEKPVQKTIQKPPVKHVVPVKAPEPTEEIVMIDNNEYIMRNNQLIPKKKSDMYVIPDLQDPDDQEAASLSTSMSFSNLQDTIAEDPLQQQKMLIKKAASMGQSIQIVVSNEEEYKALMNSNHSIIFDDGDSNKTLTVLSTAENSTLNNTGSIDLNSVQSSDMMIIQDNYPIAVSESISGDNSNIVVVYSHAVDEQNKQYQLITSQDIGPRFVQAPAVITQNFVTPTTPAPIAATTQVIDTQIAESWQNDEIKKPSEMIELQEMAIVEPANVESVEQSDIISVTQADITPVHTQLTTIVDQRNEIIEQTEMITIESESIPLNELPQVSLEAGPSETTEVSEEITSQDGLSQFNENVESDDLAQIPEATENVNVDSAVENDCGTSATPMDIDVSTESAMNQPDNAEESMTVSTSSESLPHCSINIEVEVNNTNDQCLSESQSVIEQNTENCITEETSEAADDDHTYKIVESEAADTEEILDAAEQIETITAVAPTEPTNNTEVPAIMKEQIQSLASEWSEDEYDTEEQNQDDKKDSEKEPELEESIENIQQEMEKQVSDISEMGDAEESAIVSQEQTSTLPVVAPQVKITSLLNDWDENNESTNGAEDEPNEPEPTEETPGESIEVETNTEPKKDDQIQSLVNDWDDDEEEGKS